MRIDSTKIKAFLNNIWKDPVWSKVIASLTISLIGLIWYFATDSNIFTSNENLLKDDNNSKSIEKELNKIIYERIIITRITQKALIEILGNPTHTKIVNNKDIWLYLQRKRESNIDVSVKSLTIKFRNDNTVIDKSYVEFFGNEAIKRRELQEKIKRRKSTKKDVRNLIGTPSNVTYNNNKLEWLYEYRRSITHYGKKTVGSERALLKIVFIVMALWTMYIAAEGVVVVKEGNQYSISTIHFDMQL